MLVVLAGTVIVVALVAGVLSALVIAGFVLIMVLLDAKPAWRWFYDPPGDVDSGRASGRFFTWRRAVATPKSLPPSDRHGH